MAHNSAAELYYSHFSGEWNATLNAGETRSGSLDRDDIMLRRCGEPVQRQRLASARGQFWISLAPILLGSASGSSLVRIRIPSALTA